MHTPAVAALFKSLAATSFELMGLPLMMYPTKLVAAKVCLLTVPAMVALAFALEQHAFAQQPSTRAPLPPAQAAGAKTRPAQGTAPAEILPSGDRQPVQMIFSPWARYCAKGLTEESSEISTKEVCFTAADGHLASGQKLVIALLIEPKEGDTKLLRVTLPLGVALVPGTRIVIDETEAMRAPFVACLAKNGCMADYKADADLIKKLKNGRSLAIQSFDRGKPISFTLPLTGFAQAYDGPANDPTTLQQDPSSDLQSHAEDHLDTSDRK